jgi:hypothetical protein
MSPQDATPPEGWTPCRLDLAAEGDYISAKAITGLEYRGYLERRPAPMLKDSDNQRWLLSIRDVNVTRTFITTLPVKVRPI